MSTDVINKTSSGIVWIMMKDETSIGSLHIDKTGDQYEFSGNNEAMERLLRRECTATIAKDVIKENCAKHDLCTNCELKSLCDDNDISIPSYWKIKEK